MADKKIRVRIARVTEQEFFLHTEFIKLDSLLKATGAAQSGGHAKILIGEGNVSVNGEVCLTRGKKLRDGDRVQLGLNVYIIRKI